MKLNFGLYLRAKPEWLRQLTEIKERESDHDIG